MSEQNAKMDESVHQLQLYEQSLQSLLMQKQQFQAQIGEAESAAKEISSSENAYRIVGNVMVKVVPDKLKAELERKVETLNLRMKSVEKQEDQIREKASKLREEIMGGMKDD